MSENFTKKTSKFPIESLPEVLKNFSLAVAESLQVSVDMVAIGCITVIASIVQKKYKVQPKKDWTEPLNLYSVIIAQPSERKSSVMKIITAPIEDYEYEYNLINERNIRLLCDDSTPEALITLLANNDGKMTVISSEGGLFDLLNGRYTKNINLDGILKAYSGDNIRIDRTGRESEIILEPTLTILLSVQPCVIEDVFKNDKFNQRGLCSRFLYVKPYSMIGKRNYESIPISNDVSTKYKDLCYKLLDIDIINNILTLSEEATEIFKNFYNQVEVLMNTEFDYMVDWIGKICGNVLRIAGILHLSDFNNSTIIDSVTMNNAIKIGNYLITEASSIYNFEEIKFDENMKYVIQKINEFKMDSFRRSDLVRVCRKFKSVKQLVPYLTTLLEMDFLIYDTESKLYRHNGLCE